MRQSLHFNLTRHKQCLLNTHGENCTSLVVLDTAVTVGISGLSETAATAVYSRLKT